jgi:hypothetical protein
MVLTKEQTEEFAELSRPMIKFLNDNFHPHVTVITTPNSAEIMESSARYVTHEFVKD